MMSTTIVAGAVQRTAMITTVSKVGTRCVACESESGLDPRNVRRGAVSRPGRARIRANRANNIFA